MSIQFIHFESLIRQLVSFLIGEPLLVDPPIGNNSSNSENSDSSESSSHSSTTGGEEFAAGGNLPPSDDIGFDAPLYEDCEMSLGEGIRQILMLFMKHSLTKHCLNDILVLLGDLLPNPNKLPRSKYALFKLVMGLSPSNVVKRHKFCSSCSFYIGEYVDENPNCQACQSNAGFGVFVEFPLENLIKSTFEDRKLYHVIDEMGEAGVASADGNITDIGSSGEYRRLKINSIPGEYDLTLVWNTDGVPVFNSSNAQLWPLQLTISEIPYHLRSKFLLVCGIWFGTAKPNMNTFLRPFSISLQTLATEGVEWFHPNLKRNVVSKVIAPISCVDAPARAAIQNIHLYNGQFGCSMCEHEGLSVKTGDGHCRVYPVTNTEPILRSSESMALQAREAVAENTTVQGVKGPTIVSVIPNLDLGSSFIPDYMHCVLLGVTRQFLTLWLSSSNSQEVWYIGRSVPEIDAELLGIKPPDVITRAPRSLSVRKFWKAAEYRSWLLYYSVPLLKSFLPPQHFQHWLLLVASIFILLSESISNLDIDLTAVLLKMFVKGVENLYGLNHCSYNVHQLVHLPRSVERWGPLWATSAFVFETGNGSLLNLVHGTQNVGMQLVNTIQLINGLNLLDKKMPSTFDRQIQTCVLGTSCKVNISAYERLAIQNLLGIDISTVPLLVYKRCCIKGGSYKSMVYKRDSRRNTYTISYQNPVGAGKMFGAIKFFVSVLNKIVCIVKHFNVGNNMFVHRETTKN
jgi:hypothetical protein